MDHNDQVVQTTVRTSYQTSEYSHHPSALSQNTRRHVRPSPPPDTLYCSTICWSSPHRQTRISSARSPDIVGCFSSLHLSSRCPSPVSSCWPCPELRKTWSPPPRY